MADELGDDPDQSDETDNQDNTEPDAGERQETTDGEDEESQQSAAEELQDSEGDTDASEMEQQSKDMDESPDDQEGEEQDDGDEPWRPQLPFSSLTNDNFYKVHTNQFDEEISAEDLCDTEELTRLRNYLDKQLSNLKGVVARLANSLRAASWPEEPSWDFDLEEGASTLHPGTHRLDPMHLFPREQDTKSAIPW